MRRLLTAIMVFCLLVGSSFGGEIHCKHFWHGMPLGSNETNDLIIRDCYAVSTNDDTKFADWVTYCLSYREVEGTLPLTRKWQTDPDLEDAETLEAAGHDDYTRAAVLRYDRGHLVPLASFKGSAHAQEVNLYSVVVPQRVELNRGVWATIEGWEREIVGWYSVAYVICGTLYERKMPALPFADDDHKVPSGFWKVIIFKNGYRWSSISFIVDQGVKRGTKAVDCLVPIQEIEKRTGLTLCPDLDARYSGFKRSMNKMFVVEELQREIYTE